MGDLWNKLLDNNMVTGEDPTQSTIYIPWYIRFMQGFAGWLAALFILGFFAAAFAFLFKKPTGGLLLSLGFMCSVGAYTVIRLQKNDFLDEIGMAFSLSGQLMVAIGLFLLKVESEVAFFMLGGYQLYLAWVVPHYSHRLLSTGFGLFSLLISLNLLGFHGVGSAFVAVLFSFIWLKENSWKQKRGKWEPIGFGFALAMVFSSGFLVTGKFLMKDSIRGYKSWLFANAEFISSLLIAFVFVNLVVVLLKENKIKFDSKTAILTLLAAAGLVLMSFKIYGISTGLILLILGFARQRVTLMVLGSLSVLSFFSWYYYTLQATLLFKSVTLIVLGLVLVVAWYWINYIYGNNTKNKLAPLKFKVIGKNKWLAALTVMVAIVAINININKKQDLIENGDALLFKLAPVDPRSLIQGDYMRLRFEMAASILEKLRVKNHKNTIPVHQGFVVIKKTENNVATFVDFFHEQTLTQNQYKIPYKFRNYQVIFTTNAFYFQEGKASHFQKSRFGLFRISDNAEMLLVNMVDEKFVVL